MHDPVWKAREKYIAEHWQPIPLPCEQAEELEKAQKRLETLKAKGFTGWRALLEERKIKAEKNVAEKKGKNPKAQKPICRKSTRSSRKRITGGRNDTPTRFKRNSENREPFKKSLC